MAINEHEARTLCTPEICVEKWKSVSEQLSVMHDDFSSMRDEFKELRTTVTNGLNSRVLAIEIERKTEKEEAEKRRKHWARWEASAVTLVMACVAAGILFVAKQYFDSQTKKTRQILEEEFNK